MSSSGIQAISSGPLIIRTYNNSSSSDVTYVLKDYDYPVSSNYVLITSTNGQLVPSDNIYVSSITTSSFNSEFIRASTAYLSSVFGFSPVQFYSPVRINNTNPPTDGPQLFVNGSTVFSEPGAQSTPQIAGVNIWGLPNGNPIISTITTTRIIDISEPISKINFQLIGSGGQSSFSNPILSNEDLPGIGAYIAGTLAVKQGDKLSFFIGTLGSATNGSQGTSLVYLSSVGGGVFVSTLVCVAGAGGGNGFSPTVISTSSGGGHGGGGNGGVTTSGNVDFYAFGTVGYDGISTINGNFQTFADGGQGGINNPGPPPSGGFGGGQPGGTFAGSNGDFSSITSLLTTGGLVNGGAGGVGTRTGGFGGGGYLGGGGGQGGVNTSAGGGGGATYIAVSTLANYLSNLVCLGGQWISQNNATPFGGDYGLPNNPGYAAITGYQPNDTLYTNGDIECRVLRYTMLDPPINAIGGASALWALYPAIDIVHMNDNPIVECGGIEVDKGGITVSNFVNIQAGANDSDVAGGFMSKLIRTASSGTQTIDYQVAGDPSGFGSNTWQDARYVYNPANTPNNLSQVWGIVTSSNITPVGSTIGDIHFYNNVYVDGNVGIKTVNPGFTMDVLGSVRASTYLSTNVVQMNSGIINNLTNISSMNNTLYTSTANIRTVASTNIYYSQYPDSYDAFKVELYGANLVAFKSTFNGSPGTFLQNSGGGQFALGTSNPALFINGGNNNIGIATSSPTTTLQVAGTISTNSLVTSSITTNAASLNIVANEISTIGNLTVTGSLISVDISPVGAINMYAGLIDPPGWLICDGRPFSRTITYNTLFSVIGTTFGSGDGATTFNIPDMRNRFTVGVGSGYSIGSTGGFVSTTLDSTQIPAHTHPVTDPGHGHKMSLNFSTTDSNSGSGGGIEWDNNDYGTNNNISFNNIDNNPTTGTDGIGTYYGGSGDAGSSTKFALKSYFNSTGITIGNNSGGGQPFDNRPPYFGINYIIKY